MSQKVFFAISKSSKNICDKVHHHASSFTKNIFHQRSFTLLLTDSDICRNCLVCKYIKVSFKTINYVFYGNSQVPPCLVFDHTGKTRKLMSLFKIILYKYLAKIICVIYYAQKDIWQEKKIKKRVAKKAGIENHSFSSEISHLQISSGTLISKYQTAFRAVTYSLQIIKNAYFVDYPSFTRIARVSDFAV